MSLIEFDHLIDKPKLEENEKLEDHVKKESRLITQAWADPSVKELPIGTYLQFERRGNYRIDKKRIGADGSFELELIFIPDGKSKGMSNIKQKVDAEEFSKGGEVHKEPKKPEAEQPDKKPKAEKKVDEAIKAQKMKEKAEKLAQQEAAKAPSAPQDGAPQ